MPELGSLVATFVAGLLSFFTPCTAPLLPAYLACISGVSAVELTDSAGRRRWRGRLLLGSVLYILGFATVFIALGVGAGGVLGKALLHAKQPVEIVGGILVVILGVVILGVARVPLLSREWKLELPERIRGAGIGAAYPIGIVFGIGWTPCIGVYLGVALGLASASGTALTGGILLAVFALGLGLPFIVVSLAWASLPALPQRFSRLTRPFTLAGGVVTIALGLALATGFYDHITSVFARFTTPQ